MLKKVLSVILAVLMLFSALSVGVFAAKCNHVSADSDVYCDKCGECILEYVREVDYDSDDITDDIVYKDEICITGCKDTSVKRLVIPSTIDGYTVVGISGFSYYDFDTDNYVECKDLEYVEIPETVTYVSSDAFVDTALYNNPENWEDGALYVGNWIVGIDCNVSDIVIKDGTEYIANYLFTMNDSIRSVYIPASMTDFIGKPTADGLADNTFRECYALENIYVDPASEYYTSVDGVMFNKDMTALYHYPAGKTGTEYIVPDGVKEIGWCAFDCNSYLETIVLPEGVETIADGYPEISTGAFTYCTNLKNIQLPSSLKHIGRDAFEGCYSLTDITIPDGVESIGFYAFYFTGLKSIIIPASVTEIGYDEYSDFYGEGEEFPTVFFTVIPADDIWDYENYEILGTEKLVIYGYAGTTAEKYAKQTGITFVAIEECHVTFNSESNFAFVSAKATVSDVIDAAEVADVKIFSAAGKELGAKDSVGTGCIIECSDGKFTVVVPSDVDGNGKVSAADARLALRASAKLENFEGAYAAAADFDGDGNITAADARMILRKSAGLE